MKLRVVPDAAAEWTETFDQDVIKIGRLSSAHLVLPSPLVSRMHAVIERTQDGPVIIDLGSETGTGVNGQAVNKATLRSGDTIQIGTYTLFISFDDAPSAPEWGAPAEKNRCPRCGGELQAHRAKSEGGYRGGVMFDYRRCDRCRLSVLETDTIAKRYDRSDGRLSGTMLERERRGCDDTCPDCLGELLRLTLTWGTLWVELEECPECGTIVMDDGEGAVLDRLLVESGA
jgi:hypothetical protein